MKTTDKPSLLTAKNSGEYQSLMLNIVKDYMANNEIPKNVDPKEEERIERNKRLINNLNK